LAGSEGLRKTRRECQLHRCVDGSGKGRTPCTSHASPHLTSPLLSSPHLTSPPLASLCLFSPLLTTLLPSTLLSSAVSSPLRLPSPLPSPPLPSPLLSSLLSSPLPSLLFSPLLSSAPLQKVGVIEYPSRDELEEALRTLDDTRLDGKRVSMCEVQDTNHAITQMLGVFTVHQSRNYTIVGRPSGRIRALTCVCVCCDECTRVSMNVLICMHVHDSGVSMLGMYCVVLCYTVGMLCCVMCCVGVLCCVVLCCWCGVVCCVVL